MRSTRAPTLVMFRAASTSTESSKLPRKAIMSSSTHWSSTPGLSLREARSMALWAIWR